MKDQRIIQRRSPSFPPEIVPETLESQRKRSRIEMITESTLENISAFDAELYKEAERSVVVCCFQLSVIRCFCRRICYALNCALCKCGFLYLHTSHKRHFLIRITATSTLRCWFFTGNQYVWRSLGRDLPVRALIRVGLDSLRGSMRARSSLITRYIRLVRVMSSLTWRSDRSPYVCVRLICWSILNDKLSAKRFPLIFLYPQ